MPSVSLPFAQVDVFTCVAFKGNPVAVVFDADGLSTAQMQSFTAWTNLSEAVFFCKPTDERAHYRLRIFDPTRELPFAGHPTLGACHAWLARGARGDSLDCAGAAEEVIRQECGIGIVDIRRRGSLLSFAAPAFLRHGPLPACDLERICRGLHLSPHDIVASHWIDNGPGWRGIVLKNDTQLRSLSVDAVALGAMDLGVIAPCTDDDKFAFEVRAFFPSVSGAITEDPVTGSLHAAFGVWLIGAPHVTRAFRRLTFGLIYLMRDLVRSGPGPPKVHVEGSQLHRDGVVHVEQQGDRVWVGGECVQVLSGHAMFEQCPSL